MLHDHSELIRQVPSYDRFYTVDELDVSSRRLAQEYPDCVELLRIGEARSGCAIHALRVGDGELTALLFGLPHPEEPIGSLMIEFLSKRLASDENLRDRLGFTWYFVKCSDPDGARLNEGWFAGPLTPLNYALHYYRPPIHEQVEWTFPVEYKTVSWKTPLPETKALMGLMEKIRPDYCYGLHNSNLGGVYFYVSDRCPPLYSVFKDLVAKEGLVLHRGEPEVPYMEQIDDGIYAWWWFETIYRYIEENTGEDPAKVITHGMASDDYVKRISNPFTTVCEMPYWYDPVVADTSSSDVGRREAALNRIRMNELMYESIRARYETILPLLTVASPFRRTLEAYIRELPDDVKAERNFVSKSQAFDRLATKSERYDCYTGPQFYGMLVYGILRRALEFELEKGDSKGKSDIRGLRKTVTREMRRLNEQFMSASDLRTISIQKMVRIQLGVALYAADYVREEYR